MLRRIWDVKSPLGAAGSVGDGEPEQTGQLGMLGTSRPAVAVGVTHGPKCANLTFSCSLKCVFVCPDVQRRGHVRELIRHLLHMARTTSQTCESRHHAECSVSCGANTDPGRPPTPRWICEEVPRSSLHRPFVTSVEATNREKPSVTRRFSFTDSAVPSEGINQSKKNDTWRPNIRKKTIKANVRERNAPENGRYVSFKTLFVSVLPIKSF